MWTKTEMKVILYIGVMYFSIYSIMCGPVLKRRELNNLREILDHLYSNENSEEHKRFDLRLPNLGYGNNLRVGSEMADNVIAREQYTGANTPGKRSVDMCDPYKR